MKISKDILLSADNVSAIMTQMLWRILNEPYHCHMSITNGDYWCVVMDDHRLTICEIAKLMDAVNAPREIRYLAFPSDDYSVNDITMEASEELLKAYMGIEWEKTVVLNNALLLVAPTEPEKVMEETSILRFGNTIVDPSTLQPSSELRTYLSAHGPTYDTLEAFCDEYYNTNSGELFRQYPITDEVHTGAYIVLCSDGILSLPYDSIDCENGYEQFIMEDVRFFDKDSMSYFIEEYDKFSKDLTNAMTTMFAWLSTKD